MILSPKAGGVGLTLTAANNVIHLEMVIQLLRIGAQIEPMNWQTNKEL